MPLARFELASPDYETGALPITLERHGLAAAARQRRGRPLQPGALASSIWVDRVSDGKLCVAQTLTPRMTSTQCCAPSAPWANAATTSNTWSEKPPTFKMSGESGA